MEEKFNQEKAEKGISLIDLWIVFKKYWLQLIVFTVIAAVAAGILANSLVTTTYTASIRLVINPNNVYSAIAKNASQQRVANEFGLSVYPSLKDFLTTTDVVAKIVREEAKNDPKKYEKESPDKYGEIDTNVRKGNIACTQVEDSLMFTISYTTSTSDKNAAATIRAISDALIGISQLDPEGNDYKATVDAAQPNSESNESGSDATDNSSASTTTEERQYLYPFGGMLYHDVRLESDISTSSNKPWEIYPILAFVIVFVLLYLYFLLLNIFDDSVKSKTEIEEITGFNVIAFIEDITERKKKKKKNS